MWWFGNLWAWLIGLFVEKAVDSALHRHVEPEQSDWDWSKSADTKQSLDSLELIAKTQDVPEFLARVSALTERGFSNTQLAVMGNLRDRLREGEHRFVEYHVKAFGKGTPLRIVLKRLDSASFGIIVWTDPVLLFEIAKFVSEFDRRGKKGGTRNDRSDTIRFDGLN